MLKHKFSQLSFVIMLIISGCRANNCIDYTSHKYVRVITDSITAYFDLHKINEYALESNDSDPVFLPYFNHNQSYDFIITYGNYIPIDPQLSSFERYTMFFHSRYGMLKMLLKKEAIIMDNNTKQQIDYDFGYYTCKIVGEADYWYEVRRKDGRCILEVAASTEGFFNRNEAIELYADSIH